MPRIDPEQEGQRLRERYAGMSDLQLLKVGKDATGLTEWAKRVFSEEMAKRGIDWTPEPRKIKDVAEGEILVELGVYANRYAAALAKEALTDVGIIAYFHEKAQQDQYGVVTTDKSGGTQVLVRAKDLAVAREQLKEEDVLRNGEQNEGNELNLGKGPVVLRRYRDMPAAFVEKSALESAGIKCFLQDDNVIRMDWLWSNAMGGIKLLVREEDALEAEKILGEIASVPEADDGEGK